MTNTIKKQNQPIELFRNIALTFSGGGYRASTFGLGILSYLDHIQFKGKPLLDNVKGLSTVSGGTLTGATYAYRMAKGDNFKTFFSDFYGTLREDKLLGLAVQKLDSNKTWDETHKKRSLINAFALVYNDLLTDADFRFIKENKSHLEDICFNATDFSFGLAFRFQTTGVFGNYRLKNGNLDLLSNDMKIADMIASSSCFPMGFEPLVMPDDFVSDHNSDTYIAIKIQDEFKNGVGIMDGGIVDNQGIGSIMNADRRRKDPYDLIMVCDVGSYFMDPWEPSKIELDKKGGSKSLKQLYKFVLKKLKSTWWLWLSLPISAFLLYLGFQNEPGTWYLITGGAMGMLALFAMTIKILIGRLRNETSDIWKWLMGMVPGFMKDKLKYFENLKLRLIKRMLEERGSSAMLMISSIFLKQIRRLNYNLFYKDDDLKNRRITALIYELTRKQHKDGDSDEKDKDTKRETIDDPGDGIYASAKIATEMGTTLWFSEKDKEVHRLKNLVSCGQFTACYDLLKYCVDLKESKANVDSALLNEMIDVLQADWKHFIKNPYWLHDNLLEK